MKKIENLGRVLSREESKRIFGGPMGEGCPSRPENSTSCKCISPDPDGWCTIFSSNGGNCKCLGSAPPCYDWPHGCTAS